MSGPYCSVHGCHRPSKGSGRCDQHTVGRNPEASIHARCADVLGHVYLRIRELHEDRCPSEPADPLIDALARRILGRVLDVPAAVVEPIVEQVAA